MSLWRLLSRSVGDTNTVIVFGMSLPKFDLLVAAYHQLILNFVVIAFLLRCNDPSNTAMLLPSSRYIF